MNYQSRIFCTVHLLFYSIL